MRTALAAVLVATVPLFAAQPLYFPPPGEGLDVQSRWSLQQAGLNPTLPVAMKGAATRWAVWRWGHLIHVEGAFNELQEVASARKTWQAMLVGASLQNGKIKSIDDKIGDWLPEYRTGPHSGITWRHLLTQSSGLDYPYGDYPAYKPGEMWTYSDLTLLTLCNAMARVYGHKDFHDNYESIVRQAYFDAIGLRGWKIHEREDGIGFYFDLEDMGRLGLLALTRGNWNGRQLIPEWFVEALETKQTKGMKVNYNGPNDGVIPSFTTERFPEAPYGFLTWNNNDGNYYRGASRKWAWAWGKRGSQILWNHETGIVWAAYGALRIEEGSRVANIIEENMTK